MTRRVPPSRRDSASLDAAMRQVHRGWLSQAGPGFVGGRLALAQPVPGTSWADAAGELGDDADVAVDGLLFFQDDHQVTTEEAAAGRATVRLTYEPVEHSEHTYWRPANGAGLYLPGSTWHRDGFNLEVAAPAGLLAAGDRLTVEYAHLGIQSDPDPVATPTYGCATVIPTAGECWTAAYRDSRVVGDPYTALSDGDPATYMLGEGEWGWLGRVSAEMTQRFPGAAAVSGGPLPAVEGMRAAVWLGGFENTMPSPPEARLTASPGADYKLTSITGSSGGLPAPAGWTVIELLESHATVEAVTGGGWGQNGTGSLYMSLQPAAPPGVPGGQFYGHVKVTEMRLVFYCPGDW